MSRGLPLRAIVSILSYASNSLPCGVGNSERLLGIGKFKQPFFLVRAISPARRVVLFVHGSSLPCKRSALKRRVIPLTFRALPSWGTIRAMSALVGCDHARPRVHTTEPLSRHDIVPMRVVALGR